MSAMNRTALAIRHVHFQNLGVFEAVLKGAGYSVRYCDVTDPAFAACDAFAPDLMFVLGGPVGVYDRALYPFLDKELALLKARMAADLPTFGLCLGAQQMAAALGAEVRAMERKEIEFAPLTLTAEGKNSALRHLEGLAVLHWHGDMFDIPSGSDRLAATAACPNQAFARGSNIMALQCHPEVDAICDIERWLVGHAVELAFAKADIHRLRADAVRHGEALKTGACKMFEAWLKGLHHPTFSKEPRHDAIEQPA
jgi:GMP synthase (glutamine-hydrolysing)